MIEGLLQTDQEWFLYLNNLGTTTFDGFWLFVTNKWGSIPLYGLLLLFSFKYFGWKQTAFVLLAVALLITCVDQLANFFKYGVQRLRPCHEPTVFEKMRLVKSHCGGKYSYFSAHAANSMAVAVFFMHLFKVQWSKFIYVLLFWALAVGYSRIYIGVHYPLDVLTGFVIGSLFGWLFAKLFQQLIVKFKL